MQVNNELNAGSVLAGLSRRDGPEQDSGRSEFLQLMIAQLKNQDPLDPQDNGEFLSQLAQFSSLESMQNLEKGFDRLATSLTSGTALQAASLVGREVLVASNTAHVGEGGMSGQVQMPGGAERITLDVLDAAGALVRRLELAPSSSGRIEFHWDGRTGAGEPAGPGSYTFTATALVDGEAVGLEVDLPRRVQSVSVTDAGAILNIEGVGATPITDVREFR